MIGTLTGIITQKQPPQLLIDVSGVGYEVFATMNTFYHLPESKQTITLFTHLVVREDAHTLYGFYTQQERSLFRALIKVNGVGPKLALGILSGIEPDHFVQSIQNKEAAFLVRIPGIGKKTAERLIIEMQDKLENWATGNVPAHLTSSQTSHDAISALVALGYKQKEAEHAIKNIFNDTLSCEQLIRDALKTMMI